MRKLTRQQFASLTPGQKLSYLFGRYTVRIALAVFLVASISSLIYEEYFKEQPLLQVGMIDVRENSADSSSFARFLEQEGYSADPSQVKLEKRYQFGGGENDLKIMPEQLVICDLAIGKTDIYFWDTAYMEQTLADHALVDLRGVLSPEFLEANQDKLIFTGPLLDGGYPCGISLRNNGWVTENNYYGDCAVGISRTTRDPELSGQFLEYIS